MAVAFSGREVPAHGEEVRRPVSDTRDRSRAANGRASAVRAPGGAVSRAAVVPIVVSAPAPVRRPEREDTSHAGLMTALDDEKRTAALMAKMQFMARTRYGIRAQDAHDIFHESVATYLQIHGRYPPGDNHFGLLV